MRNFLLLFVLSGILLTTSCKPKEELTQPVSNPQTDRELEICKEQVTKLESQLASMEQQIRDLNEKVLMAEGEKVNLQDQVDALNYSLNDVSSQMEATSDDFGIWFRVQIGAYSERQIDKNLQTTDGMGLEQKDDLQKIVLGRFRTYEDAKRLQAHLQTIGLKDAWIASYKDGSRISIEEARKG